MKRLNALSLIFCFGIALLSCKEGKKITNSSLPGCISERITRLKSQTYPGSQPQILQYTYNGHLVYYIPPSHPDAFGELIDSACNTICHPDGGITGKGDGKCTDFFTKRTGEKIIWKKE